MVAPGSTEALVDEIVYRFMRHDAPGDGMLCHYTPAPGFYGIVGGRRVWATCAARMDEKDRKEMLHAEPIIEKAFLELETIDRAAIRAARERREERSITRGENVGIACLTTERDSECHWREHGRSEHGAAFCMRLRLLKNESVDLRDVGLGLMRVRYNEDELQAAIIEAGRKILAVPFRSRQDIEERVAGIARVADSAAVSFKNEAEYSWEKEHRLIALARVGTDPWNRTSERPRIEVPLRPGDLYPELDSVLVRGTEADLEQAITFLRDELHYGGGAAMTTPRPPWPREIRLANPPVAAPRVPCPPV